MDKETLNLMSGLVSLLGTADLTGVTLFSTVSNNFYLGADSNGANPFVGNTQEIELFVGENPVSTIPLAIRSTAYIPAVNWQSISTFIKTDLHTIYTSLFVDESQFSSFGVPIVGSDLHFYLSIDNGVSWHEITLAKTANLTTALVCYAGSLSCTGLTNTNQLKYKITSAAGKVIKYDGCIIYWA